MSLQHFSTPWQRISCHAACFNVLCTAPFWSSERQSWQEGQGMLLFCSVFLQCHVQSDLWHVTSICQHPLSATQSPVRRYLVCWQRMFSHNTQSLSQAGWKGQQTAPSHQCMLTELSVDVSWPHKKTQQKDLGEEQRKATLALSAENGSFLYSTQSETNIFYTCVGVHMSFFVYGHREIYINKTTHNFLFAVWECNH